MYVAGRQGRDVVDARLDAVEDLALEDDGAGRVLELDVVRRARVLVVEGDRERLPAGAVNDRLDEGDALGLIVTSRRSPAAARPTRAVRTPAAPTREARRPGTPDAPGPPAPLASLGREDARLEDRRTDDQDGQDGRAAATGVAGGGPLSSGRSVSASTVRRYSMTASVSQPTSVAIRAMTPTASSQPPNTRPRNSSEDPERAEERAARRAGHVDAGRRAVVDDGRQVRASSGRCRGRRCAALRASQ